MYRRFHWKAATIAFAALELLVLIQALFAYLDHFFTVTQMTQSGVAHGLPFLWHFGMWSDFFIVSPLAAYLIGRYFDQWQGSRILLSMIIGFASSSALHWTYTFSATPEAHVQNQHLTQAGIVHFLYMGLGIAAFLQALFFTPLISPRVLRWTTLILALHVILGTHMVLGVVSALSPQVWYPARPLESIAGWVIIALVVVVLQWRSYIVDPEFYKNAWGKLWAYSKLQVGQDLDSIEAQFKFLHYFSRIVGFGFLFDFAWQVAPIRSLEGWIAVVTEAILPSLLVMIIAVVYFLSRHSVTVELGIAKKLFPEGRTPKEWGTEKQRKLNAALVILFLAGYVLLAYFSRRILVVAAIMFFISCNDLRTRHLIERDMKRFFLEIPAETELISRRRAVVLRYFERPTLRKEAARAFGCATAVGLAAIGYFKQTAWLNMLSYLVLIFTLVLNEAVTFCWRFHRDGEFIAVEEDARKAEGNIHGLDAR
jgi:hypothetical protein